MDAPNGNVGEWGGAGIVDAVGVVNAAVVGAIRSVALALTIDAMVHTRSTEISVDPQ